MFPDTIESDANETTIKASKKKRKASGTQSKPTQVGMVVLYLIYSNLVLLDYMIFSNFNRILNDDIYNYNFILIYANNFLFSFSELLSSKASEMPHPSIMQRERLHSSQNIMNAPISTSTFQMIRKYNTSNEYEFVGDWYVQIECPPNMFPDMCLFGSIGEKDPIILGIVVNCYAHGETDIVFQVEAINGQEVKLVSCQVEYTKFRPDLIEASSKDPPNTMKESMFKLNSYESFNKSGLKSCIDLLERITKVLKYRNVKKMKTSSVLLYLHQRGKLPHTIPENRIDAHIHALRRIYLKDLEENIASSGFTPTTEFKKTEKMETETVKLADNCDEIHESFKECYLFSSSFNRKVDVQRCIEAPKVFKLRSRDDANVQVLVKSFLEKFQTSLPDALLIPFDKNEPDPLVNHVKIVNETDINAINVNFWIVDGQHTIQAAKEIITNPKYSVSAEAKKKYKERSARFLDPSVDPSVVIRICCQLNSANNVFFKTPFIDCVRSARQFLIDNDKLKKRRIGNSKTSDDKVCNFNYFCT